MNGTIGIDTSLLIDFFKGETSAVEFVKENVSLLRISELVVFEFLCGNLKKKDKDLVLKALHIFPSCSLTRESSLIASELFRNAKRKGKTVGQADCLIAGSYLAEGTNKIVTRNKKHFGIFSECEVIEY